MSLILDIALYFALGCFVTAIGMAVYRLAFGPSMADRILALDAMYINGMLTLLTLGLRFGSSLYFDIGLLICIFGFVGSVAMAKFLLRGEVIEP
ncbi:MAG TPA: K+/H+ antiporter subunit F [Burkholderiaceae bacterium]|nr:K+/H+ antiporter subunit F [Burkholderiaceae bacterium]